MSKEKLENACIYSSLCEIRKKRPNLKICSENFRDCIEYAFIFEDVSERFRKNLEKDDFDFSSEAQIKDYVESGAVEVLPSGTAEGAILTKMEEYLRGRNPPHIGGQSTQNYSVSGDRSPNLY
ncbi:MAG TPA: hypothetical protein VMV95_02015 [Bacillota bacterium]|nr:hypothetical protein [Bacillota bacterium]